MDKVQQRRLSLWLKGAVKPAKSWLILTLLCGTVAGLATLGQAWVLANLLHQLIIESTPANQLTDAFLMLAGLILLRAAANGAKERFGFHVGAMVRQQTRQAILDKLDRLGSAFTQTQSAGSWSTTLLDQVEQLNDFYCKYLPQMVLAALIPTMILVLLFPINWIAGIILLATAPLTVLFMAIIGMGAADANKRNFKALGRLSTVFLDRLKGLSTIRQFAAADRELNQLNEASEDFRHRTMEVLRMAFLSSAVLEFFAAISIALIAVYFGFSYLGHLNFGHYGLGISLFTGFLVLLLAPEFYQPLRDLGSYYHAKAQALGAAESIIEFLERPEQELGQTPFADASQIAIEANNLVAMSIEGTELTSPVSFHLEHGQKLALIGQSGAGKTSILQVLMGLLPYTGSVKVNGQELRELLRSDWLRQYSWLGQNPALIYGSVEDNLKLGQKQLVQEEIAQACQQAHFDEVVSQLPQGINHPIHENNGGLSVGQAQRLALARALLKNAPLLLLDEPTASLDAQSEAYVMDGLKTHWQDKTVIMVTHRQDSLDTMDHCVQLTPREGKTDV